MTLVALAIVAGTLGAYASKAITNPCESAQQFYFIPGFGYVLAPYWYYCLNGSSANCTYYITDTAPFIKYTVCTIGLYGE